MSGLSEIVVTFQLKDSGTPYGEDIMGGSGLEARWRGIKRANGEGAVLVIEAMTRKQFETALSAARDLLWPE